MPTLNDFFVLIGSDLKIEPDKLIAYAAEDTIGGYHKDAEQAKWPMGSCYEVEGQALYALVRALRPLQVLEIGVYFACSTTHLLAALDKNKRGKLISYDVEGLRGDGPPEALRKRWEFIQEDANLDIPKRDWVADFAFEDGFHTREGTEKTLRTIEQYVKPKVLISHDAEHVSVGPAVRAAWGEVFGGRFATILIPPSDCGFAWKVRGNT
jgi:hypothetical protein